MIFLHRARGASPHLNQLHEVLEVLLLVDGELAVVVDDAVVLHFAVAADAQRVVAGVVGALPHQEQARLRGVEEPLGLLPGDLPVEPAVRAGRRRRKRGVSIQMANGDEEGEIQNMQFTTKHKFT